MKKGHDGKNELNAYQIIMIILTFIGITVAFITPILVLVLNALIQ